MSIATLTKKNRSCTATPTVFRINVPWSFRSTFVFIFDEEKPVSSKKCHHPFVREFPVSLVILSDAVAALWTPAPYPLGPSGQQWPQERFSLQLVTSGAWLSLACPRAFSSTRGARSAARRSTQKCRDSERIKKEKRKAQHLCHLLEWF